MTFETWRVGELAQRTGLSIRALHHYDEIGLLCPSQRGAGGQRLYSARDIARLERIVALKSLGLALEEIAKALDRPDFSLRDLLGAQLARSRERIVLERRLVERLETLQRRLDGTEEASVDELIETIEVMTMIEKYYTPEQLEALKQRADALGPEGMRAAQAEWPKLMADMRAEMEKGTDPGDPRVQALAKRWKELVEAFTGGDPGIQKSLSELYEKEPEMRAQNGMDPALMAYVGRAQGRRGA